MKPILSLDFDGVIHSYTSKWESADIIPDPPVQGALDFIKEAIKHFRICVFSTRSHQDGGIDAMKNWFDVWSKTQYGIVPFWIDMIEFPTTKPPALIMIDDRAIPFEGQWPNIEMLKTFKPWNKRT